MTVRLVVSPLARSDIAQYASYIGADSPASADRFIVRARETMASLLGSPRKGRLRDVAWRGLRTLRTWPVDGFPNHLILYTTGARALRILRVVHGARDLGLVLRETRGWPV